MNQKYLLSLLAVACFLCPQAQNVVINEVAYTNRTLIEDADGDTPDWIELYNRSNVSIDLKGFFLSDDKDDLKKWEFPSVSISANGFLLVFASGKNRNNWPDLHTSFKLGAMQENVYLSDNQGVVSDSLLVRCSPADKTLGRYPDGSSIIKVFNNPSPNASNNNSDTLHIVFQTDTLYFSHKNGFYQNPFNLELHAGNPENIVFYTLNSQDPDDRSMQYESPISIYNRTVDENRYSKIKTGNEKIKPKENVFKSNVIRAVVYNSGCPASRVSTKSYFVSENMKERYPVPIVSITTDPDNLFDDDNGIYVAGNQLNFLHHGKAWEREAYWEVFDTAGNIMIEQDAGIRIHGRNSRFAPQKSLRLYAREKLGNEKFN